MKLIQVLSLKTAIGLRIACFGLIPLSIYATNGFSWRKKSEGVKNERRRRLAVLFRAWTFLKTNKRQIIGNALFFVLGLFLVYWLNGVVYPDLILIVSSLATIYQIFVVGIYGLAFVILGFLIWAIFRKFPSYGSLLVQVLRLFTLQE